MTKPKSNIKRDFIVPLLGIIGCFCQICFSWLIVYGIVTVFTTCFNLTHSKLVATIIWLFLPLVIKIYRLLRNKVIGKSWEELCDIRYCAKCKYHEEHENGMCNVDYGTGKCFVVKEKK